MSLIILIESVRVHPHQTTIQNNQSMDHRQTFITQWWTHLLLVVKTKDNIKIVTHSHSHNISFSFFFSIIYDNFHFVSLYTHRHIHIHKTLKLSSKIHNPPHTINHQTNTLK